MQVDEGLSSFSDEDIMCLLSSDGWRDNVVEYITGLPELGFEFWKLQQQLERAGWKLERLS